jgi:anti-sigma B factor antagonist
VEIEISYLKKHDAHIVKVKGRLDSYYASQLEDSLHPVLKKSRKLIVECSNLTFLSSAGIRVFISLSHVLKSKGGGLVLLNLQETAKKSLRTSKTLDLFCHTNDGNEAIRLLRGKGGGKPPVDLAR